jgi:hypothetical protein
LLSTKNDTAKAIDYLLNRWAAFTRFLNDGRVCLSNNAAEQALRGPKGPKAQRQNAFVVAPPSTPQLSVLHEHASCSGGFPSAAPKKQTEYAEARCKERKSLRQRCDV